MDFSDFLKFFFFLIKFLDRASYLVLGSLPVLFHILFVPAMVAFFIYNLYCFAGFRYH